MVFFADNTLLKLLGFNRDAAPEDAELDFAFANMPESWGVFVFVGIVLALVWLVLRTYKRENPAASAGKRRFLSVLRLLVLAILVVVWLDPSLTYTKKTSLRPMLSVLRDSSQSMAIEDETAEGVKSPVRAGLVDAVLSADDWVKPALFCQ